MNNKRGITFYLQVHQPYRVKPYSVFDTTVDHSYFNGGDLNDPTNNQNIFNKVADKSYRPMNYLLEKLLEKHPDFKLSLSLSGLFLEQAEKWAPDVLDSFKRLVATGRVELLAETYYHSLAFFYSKEEFERQVKLHSEKIKQVFGVEPKVFRNTELAYNNDLAVWAESRGYTGILAEGWDPILDWRSPNFVYQPEGTEKISLLLKNYRLSDDLAFRFNNRLWSQWPLTVDKYTKWVEDSIADQPLVNLFMDYETFGEHQWADTGIFAFFEKFVAKWLSDEQNTFYTISDAISVNKPVGIISMPDTVTWADKERDLSAWLGNSLQQESAKYIYALEEEVLASGDQTLIEDWRKLLASDHTYYMCNKWFEDGNVHDYFSPYDSPYDAFLYYINAVRDIRWRLREISKQEG